MPGHVLGTGHNSLKEYLLYYVTLTISGIIVPNEDWETPSQVWEVKKIAHIIKVSEWQGRDLNLECQLWSRGSFLCTTAHVGMQRWVVT